MTHDNDRWIPLSSTEEIIKNFLLPPRFYMRHLVRKNLRKGEPELHLLPFLVNREKQAIDIGAKETLMHCRPAMLIELEERHTGLG